MNNVAVVVLLLMLHNHFSLSAILDLSAYSTAPAVNEARQVSTAKHWPSQNNGLRHNKNECQGMTHNTHKHYEVLTHHTLKHREELESRLALYQLLHIHMVLD